MSDFDPDAYLAKKAKEDAPTAPGEPFDPDAYLAKGTAPARDPAWLSALKALVPGTSATDKAGAALRGFGQGASFGFADELGGALVGVPSGLAAYFSGNQGAADAAGLQRVPKSLGEAITAGYSATRDDMRSDNERAAKARPYAYGGGQLAGGLAVPIPGAGAAKVGQTVASRAGQLGLQGAAVGALSGLGQSESKDVGGLVRDTLGGAAVGGAMGAALGPGEALWARKLRPWLEKVAERRAVSAITPTAGLANRLRRMGVTTDDEIQQLGRDVLDARILRFGGTTGGALERTEAMMDDAGATIGDVLKQADDLAAQGVAPAYSPARGAVAARRSLGEAAQTGPSRAEADKVRKLLDERIDPQNLPTILPGETPPNLGSYQNAWQAKSQLQEALKPDEVSNLGQRMYRAGVRGVTKDIYDQVEQAAGPVAVDKLRGAAKQWGTGAKIEDLLAEANSRQQQRSVVGLMDTQKGQLASRVSPEAGVATTLLSSLLRGRGDGTLAVTADALSKVRGNFSPVLKPAVQSATEPDDEQSRATAAFLTGG